MRGFAVLVCVALIGATLSPLGRAPEDDGFPLSTFPMFASVRPRTMTLGYAVGRTAGGMPRRLTPTLIGAGEVLQAMTVVEQAILAGSRALDPLCARIAARVAADPELGDVVAIRIVVATIDAVAYLVDDAPGHEVERARCEVQR